MKALNLLLYLQQFLETLNELEITYALEQLRTHELIITYALEQLRTHELKKNGVFYMKILVTGSRGQLGYALTHMDCEHDVTGVDVDELDITNAEAVKKFFADKQFDVVVNAAAYTNSDQAENDYETAYAVNCTGVKNLAKVCKEHGSRLIHISTDYVFDGQGYKPYKTTDPTGPKCAYGKSKLAGEKVLQETLDNSVIIRTAWLYSAYGNNFMKTMLRLMKERKELKVVSDQIGTPTSVNTLVNAILNCIERPELRGIFHWTDAGVTSWYDFAVAIRSVAVELGVINETAAIITPISSDEYPVATPRPFYSVLDKKASRKAIGLEGEHWELTLKKVLGEERSLEIR